MLSKDIMPKQPHHIRMFNDMQWWEQQLIMNPWLRTVALPSSPAVFGFILGGIAGNPLPLILGVAGVGAYLARYLEKIEPIPRENGPGETPQFGLLEVAGRRFPIVIDEGLGLGMPFSRITRRSKEVFNDDLKVPGIRCRLKKNVRRNKAGKEMPFKTLFEALQNSICNPSGDDAESGGSVRFEIGLTLERDHSDGWKVIDYDNAGETTQVLRIIIDRISEDLREIGRRLSWLQASFATDLIAAHIIMALTGDKSFKGRKDFLRKASPAEVQDYLDDVKLNGRSYVGGLGIKIRRLQVTAVVAEGKLAEEADNAAIEELRRVGMIENTRAVAEAFDIFRAKMTDDSMTDREVMTAVLVNDPDARVEHKVNTHNIPDAEKLAEAILRLIQGLK